MSEKISLPDGGWALIRSAEEVPERLRRAYLEAQAEMVKAAGATVDDAGNMDKSTIDTSSMAKAIGPVHDALIHAYVKSWSLTTEDDKPQPLPVSLGSIIDLPGGLFDALRSAAEAAKDAGGGGVVMRDPSAAGDPASPTVPLVE